MAARSSKHRCFVSAFALLALLLFAFPAEGKKKGAKKSSGKKGDEALCEACKALSMEIGPKASKLVKKLGKEAAVDEVVDSFCGDFNNYRTYNQIPPTMQKGCYKVLEKKHDELHALIMNDIEGREIWDNVCKDAFCEGIPFDAERKGPSVVMDGKNEL